MNQKEYLIKNKTEKELIYFSNSLKVGSILTFLSILFRNFFTYFYVWACVALILLQFFMEKILLEMPIQYATDKVSIIVVLLIALILQTVFDWLAFRKRRHW